MSLVTELHKINWSQNVNDSLADQASIKSLEESLKLVAVWSKQLEHADAENPALCFVREMQMAAQQCVILISLCMYKASASSARTLMESCLHYTFFRTHPEELASLIRVEKYYASKSDIIDYHKMHTPGFIDSQAVFGLIGSFDKWYSQVSAIIHGQVPGVWSKQTALSDVTFDALTHAAALTMLSNAHRLVHEMLLCTAGRRLWASFFPDAKTLLLKGLAGDKRLALGLDKK